MFWTAMSLCLVAAAAAVAGENTSTLVWIGVSISFLLNWDIAENKNRK